MFDKLRVIIYFLLILTSNATLVTLAVNSCSTNGDCPENYYCDEDTCKKCLSCSLLFRKGNPCVVNFTECGDCLPGYEEISVTVNSVIKKPCKFINNNRTVPECSGAMTPKGCPPNNYCSEGTCIKCFNCSVVNRLPPANNCATGLTECGSCRHGYQEVSVTTLTNSKPCDPENVKLLKSEFVQTFQELSMIGVVIFLIMTLILYVYSKKNDNARGSNKNISLCAIPSAPPLHVMLEDQQKENTLEIRKIKSDEGQVEYSTLSYVNEQLQQAKVFQRPNASYYNAQDERSHESSIGNQSLDVDIRRLSHQFGINTIRGFQFSEQLNETVSETDRPSIVGTDERDGVPNNTADIELVRPDVSNVRIMSSGQPSEMNVEHEDRDDADSRCDDASNWTKGKLNCPNCQGRLGSFDFVSGNQCQCGSHVLPPVHIVKCKVDCRNQG